MSISNNLKNAFTAAVRVGVYLQKYITQYNNLSLTLCTLSLCVYISPYVYTHVQTPPEELKALIDQAAHQVSLYLCIVLSKLSIYISALYVQYESKKPGHK